MPGDRTNIIKPKTLPLLPRRKVLQGAVALSAASVLTQPAVAQLGAGKPNSAVQTPPSQAAAVGYNRLTFFEDFNSLKGVDVKNTRARGFNWYVNNGWPNTSTNISTYPPTPESCFSQSGSILYCGASVPSGGANYGNSGLLLATACADPRKPSAYIGQVFTGGYYTECSMAWNWVSGKSPPCPAFWGLPVEMSIGKNYYPYTEIDYFEHSAPGVNQNDSNFGVYQWTDQYNSYVNSNFVQRLLGSSYPDQNIYGCLNVPMAQNNGTGYLKYYFNNNLISEIFYSANAAPSPALSGHNVPGALSDIDAGHYYLILGWQDAGTIAVDWVKVWQL